MMAGLLAEIAPVLRRRQAEGDAFCLVSMAAGLSLARLAEMTGIACPIVRIMPNTPCAIGKGMTLVVKNEYAGEAQADELCALLAAAGEFDVIEESLMDAGASSPAAWAHGRRCSSRRWQTERWRPACPAPKRRSTPRAPCWARRRWRWKAGATPAG